MPIADEKKQSIRKSAEHTLNTFDLISNRVSQELNLGDPDPSGVMANVQALNAEQAATNLSNLQLDKRRNLQYLEKEPAVCRVVAINEAGERKTYYICRAMPVSVPGYDAAFASYRAPMGRIASFRAGEECSLVVHGTEQTFEIIERIQLRPKKDASHWDSLDNAYENEVNGAFHVDSLRSLLFDAKTEKIEDLYDSLLADDGKSSITEGLRREVLSKMGLRDQPILDKFQDEIFREHLSSQLIITGPPGTGKTTTLIRRLGQKLDINHLDEDEKDLVDAITRESPRNHNTSWLMFTPTELLKQYIKEAFAKENIAAPDQRLKTWEEYRRHLARNILGVLKTSAPGGTFILKDSLHILKNKTISDPVAWFNDFHSFLLMALTERFSNGLKTLDDVDNELTRDIARELAKCFEGARKQTLPSLYAKFFKLEGEIVKIIKQLSEEAQEVVRRNAVKNLSLYEGFFTDFAEFLDSISEEESFDDDEDEDALFDEDEIVEKAEMTSPKEAIQLYGRFLKAYSRARIQRRKISEKSRNGKILHWLGEKVPTAEDLDFLGRNALLQNSLRRFVNPARGHVKEVPKLYRKFRQQKIQVGKWYSGKPEKTNHISALEVDLIILAMLRNVRELTGQSFIKRNIQDSRYELLRSISSEFKNQILVDEATDFSAIQLASMFNLTDPKVRSFFACGDFNQRITDWGCHSDKQLNWVAKSIVIRPINISYRQSKQLNKFSNLLLETVLKRSERIDLPPGINCDGVAPVLLAHYGDNDSLCEWLRERIVEIEQSLGKLPSIAVLVNNEAAVQPLALSLNEILSDKNIQSVACPMGKVMGQDNDVRVFDIQHIKGLEFEAVFFIDIDHLAREKSGLFDKYLYVGATRAATYLGITCKGGLPEKLKPLAQEFSEKFPV